MRDLIQRDPAAWVAIGGFVIGLAFGAIVFATNFCTMGSISDFMSFGDYRRFRAWLLAAATAMLGTQLLAFAGVVPLTRSMYLSANLNWLGHIAGGAMFGVGMVFAGGCASRNLARVGGGDLRAALTLMTMGLFAYMAIGGILAPLRVALDQATSLDLGRMALTSQSLGDVSARVLGIAPATANLLAGAGIAMLLAIACFGDAAFRASRVHIFSGIGVGLCAAAGWALTGLAFDDMATQPLPPGSLTFVRPTADSLDWLGRFTAVRMPGFGVATVFGTIFGAFAVALVKGRVRVSSFSDAGDTKRSLFGAGLMGVGGVMATGCTIGQGVTGLSTLAIGSFLTFAAIVGGGMAGMKALERSLMRES